MVEIHVSLNPYLHGIYYRSRFIEFDKPAWDKS